MCLRCLKTLLILCSFAGSCTGIQSKGAKFLILHNVLFQSNKEGGTFGIDAVDADLSSHQFHQLMNNTQPQSGAFNMPVFFLVYPFESVENIRDIFFFHTLAGVFYRIPDTYPVQALSFAADGECDGAFACVFDRIIQQIDQNLLNAYFIAAEHAWDGRIYMQPEIQPFFSGLDPDHIDDF